MNTGNCVLLSVNRHNSSTLGVNADTVKKIPYLLFVVASLLTLIVENGVRG